MLCVHVVLCLFSSFFCGARAIPIAAYNARPSSTGRCLQLCFLESASWSASVLLCSTFGLKLASRAPCGFVHVAQISGNVRVCMCVCMQASVGLMAAVFNQVRRLNLFVFHPLFMSIGKQPVHGPFSPLPCFLLLLKLLLSIMEYFSNALNLVTHCFSWRALRLASTFYIHVLCIRTLALLCLHTNMAPYFERTCARF